MNSSTALGRSQFKAVVGPFIPDRTKSQSLSSPEAAGRKGSLLADGSAKLVGPSRRSQESASSGHKSTRTATCCVLTLQGRESSLILHTATQTGLGTTSTRPERHRGRLWYPHAVEPSRRGCRNGWPQVRPYCVDSARIVCPFAALPKSHETDDITTSASQRPE